MRPLRKDDLMAYHGRLPDHTVRGIVCELDGEVIGIACVVHNALAEVTLDMKESLRSRPLAIGKAVIAVRKLIKEYPCKVHSITEGDDETEARFLEYVGFTKIEDRVFVWQ